MSLSIILSDGEKLLAATDTLLFNTDTGPLDEPSEKWRIFEIEGSTVFVVATGDTELNGRKIFDIIEGEKDSLNTKSGVQRLREAILTEWKNDIEAFPWESESDREDFLRGGMISIFIATSPSQSWLLHGKFDDFDSKEFGFPIGLGRPDLILELLKNPPNRTQEWPEYFSQCFEIACSNEDVGPPIDVTLWEAGKPPTTIRMELGDLQDIHWNLK